MQLLASSRLMSDCTLNHVLFNSSPNRKLNYYHVCTLSLYKLLVMCQLKAGPQSSRTYLQLLSINIRDIARRRTSSYNVVRVVVIVPLNCWQNFTPFFGALALCTMKIDDFRTQSTGTYLTDNKIEQ